MRYCMYNWKSMSPPSVSQWIDETENVLKEEHKEEFVVFPPFPYIDEIIDRGMLVGAQDVSAYKQGSYTGDVAASLLKKKGVSFALIGHSERRIYHHENEAVFKEKIARVDEVSIIPVVCVGESEPGGFNPGALVEEIVSLLGERDEAYIAYEPQWAIGGDVSFDPSDIHKRVCALRSLLDEEYEKFHLFYGGSVGEKTIDSLVCYTEIDGFLVGSASVDITQSNYIYTSIYG